MSRAIVAALLLLREDAVDALGPHRQADQMMERVKEYGKLFAEQFKQLISKLPELRRQQGELRDAIHGVSSARLDALLVEGYNWARPARSKGVKQ